MFRVGNRVSLLRNQSVTLARSLTVNRSYATYQRGTQKGDLQRLRKGKREIKFPHKCIVAIVGLGGVGKSLAHLLKMYPGTITELRLCNRSDPEGMVEELNHIPTPVKIHGFEGQGKLKDGLKGADVVVISAGVARKKGTTRDMLFQENATICSDVVNACADTCPNAIIAMVSNPVDSLVPVAAEVLKKRGTYKKGKLIGVCQLDQIRAQSFYAEVIGAEPSKTYVPVIGGHSEITTVPLFTKARPFISLPEEDVLELVELVRLAGRKVVEAKKGAGGSTYSMASAAMYFVHKLCRAIHHEPHLILSGYVESNMPNCSFFSNECLLGPQGVEENLGFGNVTGFEKKLVDEATEHLRKNIAKGIDFVAKNNPKNK